MRVAACAVAFVVMGGVATLAGVMAALPVAGTAGRIVWVVVGAAVAALLGIGFDRQTTVLLRRVRIRPAGRQTDSEEDHTT